MRHSTLTGALLKELREDGSIPGEDRFGRIYEVKGDDWHGYNIWGGETPDDAQYPTQQDIEHYPTFVKWATQVLSYAEAQEKLRVLNKEPRTEVSTLLLDIGLGGELPELMKKAFAEEVVLGVLKPETFTTNKMNVLMSLQTAFAHNNLRLYMKNDWQLVLTSSYTYYQVRQDFELGCPALTVGLDFLFDKDRPQDRFD